MTGQQPNFNDDYVLRLMGDEPLPPRSTPEAEPDARSLPNTVQETAPTAPQFLQQPRAADNSSPATQDAVDAHPLNASSESATEQDAADASPSTPSSEPSLAAEGSSAASPAPPPAVPATETAPIDPPVQEGELPVVESSAASHAPPVAPSRQELLQQLTQYQQQYGEDATQQLLSQVLIDFERRYGVSGTRELLLNVIEDLEVQQGPAAVASVVSNLPDGDVAAPVPQPFPTPGVDFSPPQPQSAEPPPPMVEREVRTIPSPTATGNSTRQNLINLLPLALVAAIAGTALAFTLLNQSQAQPDTAQPDTTQPDTAQVAQTPTENSGVAIAGWDELRSSIESSIDQLVAQTASSSPTPPNNSTSNSGAVPPANSSLPPSNVEPADPTAPLNSQIDPSIPNPNRSPSPTPTLPRYSTPYPPPATPLPGTQLW